MKQKDDNLFSFKSFSDKLRNISDGDVSAAEEIKKSGIFDVFEKAFSEELEKSCEALSDEEIYEEIVDNYFVILKELGKEIFESFRFVGYDYCREIIVDGKEIDLDMAFTHDDEEVAEALCAIDCLLADLEDEESKLKKVEKIINERR